MATDEIVAAGTGAVPPRRSLVAASPRSGEQAVKGFLALCGILSVAVTTAIVLSLIFPTIEFFREVSPAEFLTGTDWAPSFAEPSFGVLPLVAGTLNIVFWSLVVAVPVGLLSAIFLSEYAPSWLRRTVKPMLEVLEGVPTVAIGLFGIQFLLPLAADAFPFLDWGTFSVGVAGVAVGLLTVPLVASISEDAMRSVPSGLREGAYALGASKLRVSVRVVFPAAISGIVAGVVLAVSRAVGETMVVLMVAGATAQVTFIPTESAQTMTAYIGRTSTGDIATGTTAYNTIFAVGSLLFVMTFAMNFFAIRLVRRFREVYEYVVTQNPPRTSARTRLAVAGARAATRSAFGSPSGADRVGRMVFPAFLLLGLGVAMVGLAAILTWAVVDGAERLSLDLITNSASRIFPEEAGYREAILGSLYVIAGVIGLIVPLGVGAALYLEEYADNTRWYNRLIELNIQNLAGVPSIVFGILGLAFIARGPLSLGFVAVAGSITVAMLVLPTVIIAAREAIRAVPASIREGALALGATKWQTIWRQVLPASVSGITTGAILAVARAFGEAAPLLLVGATTFVTFAPNYTSGAYTVLPVQIFNYQKDAQEEFQILAAGGVLIMLILVLMINSFAIWLRNRYEQKW